MSNIRILSFGYVSRVLVFGDQASLDNLFKHSRSFLNGLCRENVVSLIFVPSLMQTQLDQIKGFIHYLFTRRVDR